MSDQDYSYRSSLKQVERETPATARTLVFVLLAIMVVSAIIGTAGWGLGWFSDAGAVAQKEFSASAVLQKYEWFKDAAAQLDAKKANIEAYRRRQESMKSSYGSKPRSEWDRSDKEQFNLWEQELAGTVANYNGLAAEYNASMAKSNWAFANAGNLPKGAEPLPREYREYVVQ